VISPHFTFPKIGIKIENGPMLREKIYKGTVSQDFFVCSKDQCDTKGFYEASWESAYPSQKAKKAVCTSLVTLEKPF
jgi:hypothetical protein